jgi:transcription initiation factor IIE alpha subunit
MAHITKDKAIRVNGQTWVVNSKGSGLISHSIKAMINQVDVMLNHHSKILIVRFDLHIYQQTKDNAIITIFNRRLFKWLKRKYNLTRVGFLWCREQEKAKQQHYHYALMIDGHKVRHPIGILLKVKEIWEQNLNHSLEYTPKNCYYNLERDNDKSIQDAIYRISYLAKARGKGYKPDQTKNYGTSRIKPKNQPS